MCSTRFFDVLRYITGVARTKATPADPIACCAPVREDSLDEEQAVVLAESFAALADPVRLRLLSFVASSRDEVCACDLVGPSGRSQPTVSHHMKILVDAGLVTREKRGLWVWYRVAPQRLESLRAVLG
jgi:ArsR family transcriptional regulator